MRQTTTDQPGKKPSTGRGERQPAEHNDDRAAIGTDDDDIGDDDIDESEDEDDLRDEVEDEE